MNNREPLKKWIDDSLLDLPICDEDFFIGLWDIDNGTLNYDDGSYIIDDFDEIGAKLACTALSKHLTTLLVLPDNYFQRGALIFATILVKCAMQCMRDKITSQKILFFGNGVKFKHAYQSTYVGTLPVSQAFSYTQASGKFDKNIDEKKNVIPSIYLPEVICVYNPNDPEEFLARYKPKLVVIDCGKEDKLEWLNDVLRYCEKKNIPVLCWNSNCFSLVNQSIETSGGSIFFFPKKNEDENEVELSSLYLDKRLFTVEPIVLTGGNVSVIDNELYSAKTCLRKLKDKTKGSLKQDGVRIAWKYIRAIENLVVPLNIYNSEAGTYWGVHSLIDLEEALKNYINQIQKTDSQFANILNGFLTHTAVILQSYKESDPPLWRALSNYFIDNFEESRITIIFFPTKYQKQLFTYSLLSKSNITEEELFDEFKVVLKTIKEYDAVKSEFGVQLKNNAILPIIIGLPAYFDKQYFYELLTLPLRVLIFPSQVNSLKYLIKEFNSIEKEHLKKSVKTLKRLSGRKDEVNLPAKADRFTLSNNIEQYQIEASKPKLTTEEITSLLNISDVHSELAALLESNESNDTDQEPESRITNTIGQQQSIYVERGLEIFFEEGYKLLLSEDDQLNIIKKGKMETVFVRSIVSGSKVMIIQNQARQSLYDLIISRVHNHPSLEVHFAILKKWSEELHLGYMIWKEGRNIKGFDEFLKLLQSKGSTITTELTVSNWLNGITLRPRDEQDIRRLGEILKIKFITDNYKRISSAAARIVGIHISLSGKLNNLLSKDIFDGKYDMEIVDEEIGLTFGELKSSIAIMNVQKIVPINQRVLVSTLGVLEKIN